MFGKQNLYMAKPDYDTQRHNAKTYASADIGVNSGYNSQEGSFYLMPGIHRAHAFSFFDVAYGSFGYLGRYQVSNIPEENGGKFYYGLGGRGSANFNARFENFEWRVVGIEGAFSKEFGGYRQMRSEYSNPEVDSLVMYHTKGNTAEFNLFTEFVFRDSRSQDYWSIKAATGYTSSFGNNDNESIRRGDGTGIYGQANVTVKRDPYIIGGNYYLTFGYSGIPIFRQGLTLSFQIPLDEIGNQETSP